MLPLLLPFAVGSLSLLALSHAPWYPEKTLEHHDNVTEGEDLPNIEELAARRLVTLDRPTGDDTGLLGRAFQDEPQLYRGDFELFSLSEANQKALERTRSWNGTGIPDGMKSPIEGFDPPHHLAHYWLHNTNAALKAALARAQGWRERLKHDLPYFLGEEVDNGAWDLAVAAGGPNSVYLGQGVGQPKKLPDDFILRFVALSDATTSEILDFANQYGSLLPPRLEPTRYRWTPDGPGPGLQLGGRFVPQSGGPDLVEEWRAWARCIEATLRITVELKGGARGGDYNWRVLSAYLEVPPLCIESEMGKPTPRRERACLSGLLSGYLQLADISPTFSWNESPEIHLSAHGVFGAVVRELVFTAAGTSGLETCDNCGRPFAPEKKRAKSRKVWCEREPCKKAGNAYRSRQYRARKKRTTKS